MAPGDGGDRAQLGAQQLGRAVPSRRSQVVVEEQQHHVLLSAIVVMVIVTTLVTPPALKWSLTAAGQRER